MHKSPVNFFLAFQLFVLDPNRTGLMAPLSPLEFRDCVVDGPHFRAALHKHEKGLKASSKQVKDVYLHAERVFKAMERECSRYDFHVVSLISINAQSFSSLFPIVSNCGSSWVAFAQT
ncbi:hypothetical protein PHET_09710 [Paragonimus heterotremus]|uniref:Uncharacterized protein n=1 Tax=Paragonimus heterotremus TaxID=100268 RepID=A0A8J4WEI8_9TREM|nr:hypothetical protein PHET_09710 [Paragonimus heterotremus]